MPQPADAVDYRALVADFQPNDGDLLPALHAVQHAVGWIPREGIEAVAAQLKMPVSTVFGALSFYAEFLLEPPAQTTITWCSGPACRMAGGDRIREAMERTLGLGLNQKSEDNRVGFRLGQCNGTCHVAPMVWTRSADADLAEGYGEVRGPLSVSDSIRLAREAKGGAS